MNDGPGGSRTLLLAVLVLFSLVAVPPAAESAVGGDAPAERQASPDVVPTVAPHPNSTMGIWPYTSRARSVETATLPINVVVLADASVVRNALALRPDARWENQTGTLNSSAPNSSDNSSVEGEMVPVAANATGVYWSDADGANRYTYVRRAGSLEGEWIGETFQLHDGDYFGTRYHVRFYEVPDGENTWTAMQAHREYFDWFRLRHTVGSLPRAQNYVESQFYGQWYVADLEKRRFSDGDVLHHNGWATVVELRATELIRGPLSLAALAFGVVALGSVGRLGSPFDRRSMRGFAELIPVDTRTILAMLAIAAIPLLVRVTSIAVEHSGFVDSPKVVAGTFYPVIAFGPPLVAYVLFHGVEPGEAFVAAFVALGVGFLADYAYLDITSLPIELIGHRAVLMVALGFVAVAGTDRPHSPAIGNPSFVVGGSVWVAGLLWALFLW